jgi:hypothetical protein
MRPSAPEFLRVTLAIVLVAMTAQLKGKGCLGPFYCTDTEFIPPET